MCVADLFSGGLGSPTKRLRVYDADSLVHESRALRKCSQAVQADDWLQGKKEAVLYLAPDGSETQSMFPAPAGAFLEGTTASSRVGVCTAAAEPHVEDCS